MPKLVILLGVLTYTILQVSCGVLPCLPSAEDNAKDYLTQYGYLLPPLYKPGMPDTRDSGKAFVKFQAFANLPQTGIMDEATVAQMDKPRCGVPDVGDFGTSLNKWTSNSLTYRIDSYPPGLSIDLIVIQQEISRAWQVWADVTPLTFTEVSAGEEADFIVKFESADHGDNYPFDGPRGILAHAFFPRSGKCHFDEAETWTIGISTGINLFIAAAHEFGHNLGLKHSDVSGSLMLPFYPGYQGSDFSLGLDDIEGIQSLYGPNPDGSEDVTIFSQPPSEACTGEFQAAFLTADGTFYGVTNGYVWDLTHRLYNEPSVLYGTMSSFHSTLASEPVSQAAITIGIKTYIFKGCSAWRFYNTRFETKFTFGDYWQELPCDISAAFHANDGYTYFFKGQDVYQYLGYSLHYSGPMSSLGWNNFPSGLTSIDAISESGKRNYVYIFSGTQYWRLNQATKTFYSRYPRSTDSVWLSNCPV